MRVFFTLFLNFPFLPDKEEFLAKINYLLILIYQNLGLIGLLISSLAIVAKWTSSGPSANLKVLDYIYAYDKIVSYKN